MAAEVIATLAEIAESTQSWPVMAAKYGVENPLPPWKTSLDGMCDALDAGDFGFQDRRDEEDVLSATRYRQLPFPESQLVALAHSLIARGVIGEAELAQRLAAVRARLEAG
ncbi:thiocyanate hydrolase [Mycolicibacter hiberniae]|nr:thiocyanate hydrolase [Mycolicibacter hiberniae]